MAYLPFFSQKTQKLIILAVLYLPYPFNLMSRKWKRDQGQVHLLARKAHYLPIKCTTHCMLTPAGTWCITIITDIGTLDTHIF